MAKRLRKVSLTIKKKGGRFLELCEASARHLYDDGTEGPPYRVEFINRRGLDSVAVAVFREEKGRISLVLTGQIRIPVITRTERGKKRNGPPLFLLEVVAGSLEPGEAGSAKIKKRVAAEVLEEAGFKASPKEIFPLGAPFFTSPGQSSEKIHPFAVRVARAAGADPLGDGSILEKDCAPPAFYPLQEVFDMISRGEIADAKTEIVASRLARRFGGAGGHAGERAEGGGPCRARIKNAGKSVNT